MASKKEQGTQPNSKVTARKKAKRNKIIVFVSVTLIVVVLCIIFIPKLLKQSPSAPTSVTTYNVQAITYGDVDTTISGSGTLSPITKETLTFDPSEWEESDEDEEETGTTDTEATKETISPPTQQVPDPITYTLVSVAYTAGNTVDEGAVMATFSDEDDVEYEFTAPYSLVILDMTVKVGDTFVSGDAIATVMGTDGFTMSIAVDELDISTVKVGQEVSFSISAVSGNYSGEITNVSYSGSSSGSTTAYQITAQIDYVDGVYPGMTASAEIVIESSGEGLLVPVSAVQTSGDDSYVYIAPSTATEGQEYSENELDISTLTKAYVETGMSDGSYILVESDELSEGDLIVIATLTSTQTGSDNEQEGGAGGFGGGRPGGMGGGRDFGDFDFGDFDPGNMPSGGFPGGGGFPGMGS